MEANEVEEICAKVQKGAKLMSTRPINGFRHVKLVRGPLGLLTENFRLAESDWEEVKSRLALSH